MKLHQKPIIQQVTKLSQQTQLLLATGAGILIGATLAILAIKADFTAAQPAAPATQEQTAPGDGDTHRRPPSSLQGGTLRTLPEDSLLQKQTHSEQTPNR